MNESAPDVPNLPTNRHYEGPWLQQQVFLSLAVGSVSVLVFGVWKRHYASFYLARHRTYGSARGDWNVRHGMLAWIWPTVAVPDCDVLKAVGLDAATALLFLRTAFLYFALTSIWAVFVLMPVSYYHNGWIDGVARKSERPKRPKPPLAALTKPHAPLPLLPVPHINVRESLYENTQLLSTYLYTVLCLYMMWHAYTAFVRFRQGHAPQEIRTERARTIELRDIPSHLSEEAALRAHFAEMRLPVDHIILLRETEHVDRALKRRLEVLLRLEALWSSWLGDPAQAQAYDPEQVHQETYAVQAPPTPGSQPHVGAAVRTGRPRPTVRRPWWNVFAPRVDAIDQASYELAQRDCEVQALRSSAFTHGRTAFVTFQDAISAQIAAQVVSQPQPGVCTTLLAAEPRDILWHNEETGLWNRRARQAVVFVLMSLLMVFYVLIVTILASFLSLETIHKYLPWLGDLVNRSPRIRALVQTSLPSIIVPAFNALLPIAFEASGHFQRLRSFSSVDYSVLKKYHLFLLFSVVFIFMVANTVLGVLLDLAENPMKVIDKFAEALPGARHFSLSYVVFQALATQPFQLVHLPTILSRTFKRALFVNTPRERATATYLPTMDLATLYPQALLVFTLCILYSIVTPLIVLFGTCYFGIAYVVLKYQLLNVMTKLYESHGHAWTLSVRRCIWALFLFQVFQLSLFSVRKEVYSSLLLVPLACFTLWFHFRLKDVFGPLAIFLNLHDLFALDGDQSEAQRGPEEEEPTALQLDPPHAPRPDADAQLPHKEPPLARNCPGVLESGAVTYGQPSLTGHLPDLWLPDP